MITSLSKIEVMIEGKAYQLLCEATSPIAHVKEALFQFGKHVGAIAAGGTSAGTKTLTTAYASMTLYFNGTIWNGQKVT